MTTTLLTKDTSPHQAAVFAVFTAGGGFGMRDAGWRRDLLVADPATFRVLPWAENQLVLCNIYFTNGKPLVSIARDPLATLGEAGYDFLSGLEVEFHLFKIENPRLGPADTLPATPPTPGHSRLSISDGNALRSGRSDF